MVNKLARKGRAIAYRLVLWQAFTVIIVSLVFLVALGPNSSLSALAGGGICVVPNFVFATLAFRRAGASVAQEVYKDFFRGEALKLILVIVLFSLVFKTMQVDFLSLFVSFAVAMIVHWLAPIFFQSNKWNR